MTEAGPIEPVDFTEAPGLLLLIDRIAARRSVTCWDVLCWPPHVLTLEVEALVLADAERVSRLRRALAAGREVMRTLPLTDL